MIADLNVGGDLNKLASAKGLTVSLTKPVDRTGSGGTMSRELVKQLFQAKAGSSVGGPDAKGFTIARLKQTIAANPIADADKLKNMSKELSQSIRSELLVQLAGALRQRYPVTINSAAINAQF